MIQFASDENFNGNLLAGIRKLLPAIDIIRIQDTEMYEASDPNLLAWLATEKRVLLTHDIRTMPGYAYDRVHQGLLMPGVVVVQEHVASSQILDELEVLLGAGNASDFENLVRYVPMT